MIPIFIHSQKREPDRCPECHKEEDVKVVCAHCGYEYPEEDSSWSQWVAWLTITIVTLTIMCLFIGWATHCEVHPEYKGTFIDYLGETWKSIASLLKRIW